MAVAIVEGTLRSGYDPVLEPISALALGPRGWVQTSNFVLLTISMVSFAVVLRTALRSGASSVAAPGVFLLMAIGMALSAAFTMDPVGAPATTSGQLHELGGFLIFPWIPVAVLSSARRFRRDPEWRSLAKYTLVTGLFCLAAIVFFLVFVGPPSWSPRLASGFRGLVQRLIVFPFFAWMAVIARRAYRGSSRPSLATDAGLPVG
jgi:hypothetical protein